MSRRRLGGFLCTLAVAITPGCFDSSPSLAFAEFDTVPLMLVSGAVYPNLIVEVDYAQGFPPSDGTLPELERTLRLLTDKKEIEWVGPTGFTLPSSSGGEWSREELHEMQELLLDSADCCDRPAGDAGVLHIIYLNGVFEDPAIAGISVGQAVFVFIEHLRHPGNAAVLALYAADMEKHVVLHEVGHSLGLVNDGVPMTKDRLAPGHHSTNPDSVMNASWELVSPSDGTHRIRRDVWFDADDMADLKAFRERVAQVAREHPEEVRMLRESAQVR